MSHLIVVSGPTGCGKTTYVRSAIASSSRLVVVDPMAEYEVGGVEWGMERCCERLLAFQERKVQRFRLACRVSPEDGQWVLRALWSFCEDFAHPDPRWQIDLVVDEAHRWSRPRDIDTPFDYLCTMGRRVCRRMWVCTQRLRRISRDATSNSGSLVIFHGTEPDDLDDLRRRRGKEAVEAVGGLGPHEHLVL